MHFSSLMFRYFFQYPVLPPAETSPDAKATSKGRSWWWPWSSYTAPKHTVVPDLIPAMAQSDEDDQWTIGILSIFSPVCLNLAMA